ncbi:glycosyltransferase family 2 protein [Immundisolibacter sp.]|uniref:glycosyltransferase family 2 protein n=1 Tax=Immundisolibacter sp. TaxID=1934948 RepID=UPI002629D742|nr:glycosyltransferase family 2 protein [Immundisolibacter sp.]MDD3651848.1 glycosyltransferase family 2 protein [Immundisolibacter sp.]
MTDCELSIVLPARNEAPALEKLLPVLREHFPQAQIIVVNDGSTDHTSALCARYGVQEVRHRYRVGNGGAVKSGARAARGRVIVFMDADGQHDPADIARLLTRLADGYDMVVGARDGASQASVGRSLANRLYNRIASYMTGQEIPDLTSGFRAVRADKFREFLFLLPNGFSYPTSITMAFFRAGYGVAYEPIVAARRTGRSHIRPLHDGARFLLIIFRVATLYSPLQIFAPLSALCIAGGLLNYLHTYTSQGRFTNASAVLFTTAVVVFLMGLISEQITTLLYAVAGGRRDADDADG